MKSNTFSRILSTILALSLVIAMLPSAFAAEAGYKVVYDFTDNYAEGVPYTSGETGFFTYKGVNEVSSYDKSNGFWKFEAMNGSLSVNHAYTTANSYQSGLVSYFNSSANWYAIKVRVPASGTYSMKLEYRQHSSYESNLGVYAFSSDATSDDINADITSGTNKVGAVNFTKGSWDAPQTATVGNVTFSAGEHIIVFHSPNGKTATIRGITLTSGDGSLVAPMSASVSASKTTLDASKAGDSANITITSATYSDTSIKTSGIAASDFVFTSSNNSLATVDANGKVTVSDTATNGTVKISVAAKANPGAALGTVSFTVVASESSNAKLVYDFIDNYASDVPYTASENNFFTYKGVNEVASYDKSNGFWKFAAMESTVSVNHQYNATSAYANGLMAYFGATYSWYAIKVRVPKTDVYSASIGTIATSGHETNLEVYILDGASDDAAIAESVANGTGKVGSVDCTKGGYSALDSERRTLGNVKLSEGEHIVVFHAANGKNAKIWSFALKGGNGSVTVPMAVNASVSKTTLDASKSGDSANISIASVAMSDASIRTSGINIGDFVFESSDKSLATVDANGKITVVSSAPSGDVTISVASKDNPDFILGTVSLDVVAMVSPNVNIVYDFIDNYAEGVPYTTSEIGFFTHKGVNEVASYDKSNGFWKFAALEGLLSVNHQYNAASAYANGLMAYFGATNSWYAIKIRVPKTDIYSASIGTIATSGHETNLEVYILDGASDNAAIAENVANGTGKIGEVNCTKGGYSALDSERRTLGSAELSAGEHIVVFHAANGKNAKIWSFALKGGNGSVIVPMGAKLSAPTTLERGKGGIVSVEKVFMSDATEVSSVDGITFESSDASVVSVSGSVIRAVSTGDAEIIAKYNGEIIAKAPITVTEASLSESVSFVATSNCGAKIAVSGITYNGAVDSVAPGKTVTVSAPEVDGYKFRYWKSGNNGGRYLSSEDKYSFKLVTHTYITAVYDKIEDGKATLEFFNGNGAFIEGKSVSLGAKFGDIKIANPSLTGFAFLNWSVDDDALINGDTRAVAIYNEDGKAISGAVTVDGTAVEDVTYDKEVTAHKSGATHWLRDGKVVAYGESYTHYVWDATAITSSDKAIEKMPIVVLEDTTVDGAYMIEYDAAGYEIVEVGIVFGNDDATVGSCTSKATSQRNANHGQFAAIPSGGESGARGYIIYKDGSVNRIVYSK